MNVGIFKYTAREPQQVGVPISAINLESGMA